jgi:hypothetical protein
MASEPPSVRPPKRMTRGANERRSKAVVILAALIGLAAIVFALGPRPNEGGPRLTLTLLACGTMLLLRQWPWPVLATSS